MVDKTRLPSRFFAMGKEPNEKHRVVSCSHFSMIDVIKESLKRDESARLKLEESSFALLLKLPSMSTWSPRFAHFLLCNQLETKKKHELWFVFSGKPWRFSLKEFSIVTGLCCKKVPNKDVVSQQDSYWSSLFGDEKTVTVNWIVDRLQNGIVDDDSELLIRYVIDEIVTDVNHPFVQGQVDN